ncbi:hypothetical protein P7K49_002049 [Saguinus oedipus]|uniref:Uncharacterized protein n=1 Tax=Saguinus oedipus TaxID=9490 RepID=A0ABQ9WGA9_SAGOE|nr:hypothetical protein P7K49_002049 [Saguinus oedipus]
MSAPPARGGGADRAATAENLPLRGAGRTLGEGRRGPAVPREEPPRGLALLRVPWGLLGARGGPWVTTHSTQGCLP